MEAWIVQLEQYSKDIEKEEEHFSVEISKLQSDISRLEISRNKLSSIRRVIDSLIKEIAENNWRLVDNREIFAEPSKETDASYSSDE